MRCPTGELVQDVDVADALDSASCWGLAVSRDTSTAVLSTTGDFLLVYTLPDFELVHRFGVTGAGKAQFKAPRKLCFSAVGTVLVAEMDNKRVQEVTLSGEHVRFIDAGPVELASIAANDELIVVGTERSSDSPGRQASVLMFDAATGALVRAFGKCGRAPGELLAACSGIRFAPDNKHVIVCQSGELDVDFGRISCFTLAGKCVWYVYGRERFDEEEEDADDGGGGVTRRGGTTGTSGRKRNAPAATVRGVECDSPLEFVMDIEFTASNRMLVLNWFQFEDSVLLSDPDCSTFEELTDSMDETCNRPVAAAYSRGRVYLLEHEYGGVKVYQ